MIAGRLGDLGWAVLVGAALLVSGVALRTTGRWLVRAVNRDFKAQVRAATEDDLGSIKDGIDMMRTEQTEQHGQVRRMVEGMTGRLDLVDQRLDRIEARIYPPAPTPPPESE